MKRLFLILPMLATLLLSVGVLPVQAQGNGFEEFYKILVEKNISFRFYREYNGQCRIVVTVSQKGSDLSALTGWSWDKMHSSLTNGVQVTGDGVFNHHYDAPSEYCNNGGPRGSVVSQTAINYVWYIWILFILALIAAGIIILRVIPI